MAILILLVGVACSSIMAAEGEDNTADVYFDVPGKFLAAPVTVVLSGLQMERRVRGSANKSMLPENLQESDRTHVGFRIAPGVQEGSKAWDEAPLITKEEALVQVGYMDEVKYIRAGYYYPGNSNERRSPWMKYLDFGSDSLWAECGFEIASANDDAEASTLLEVIAIDSTRIYFSGLDADGASILLSASYSIQ